ncbi:MAG: T9SS type A sorting domain-containing protein [Chitinophagales bacterium]
MKASFILLTPNKNKAQIIEAFGFLTISQSIGLFLSLCIFCLNTTNSLFAQCPTPSNPGVMSSDLEVLCDSDFVFSATTGENLVGNDVLAYVVHTNDNSSIGNILGSFSNGFFGFDDLNNAQYNTTYYMSAVVGPDLDNNALPDLGNPCTFASVGRPIVFLAPIEIAYSVDCFDNEIGATVSYEVTGGYPQFDNAQTYDLMGSVMGGINGTLTETIPANVSFTLTMTVNDLFSLTLEDNFGCVGVLTGNAVCEDNPDDCLGDAGTMPTDIQIACDLGTVSATTTGADLGGLDILVYVIHDNAGSTIGNILGASTAGAFSFADLDGALPNTTYYLSAVVSNLDDNGNLILNDPCTDIAAGTPVAFLNPITYLITETCDETTGLINMVADISGGVPDFNPGNPYTISGTVNTQIGADQDLTLNGIPGNGVVDLVITDEINCSETLQYTPSIDCENETCINAAGVMSTAPQFVCAGEPITVSSTGFVVDNGSVLVYAFHTGASDVLDNVLQFNTNGTFTAETVEGLELATQYYISAVVAPTNNSGDIILNDPCTVVAVGTPVAFLAPITTSITETCNEETGLVSMEAAISGGLPDFDANSPYTITGAVNTQIGANQNLTVNGVPVTGMVDLIIEDEANCGITFSYTPTIDCEAQNCMNETGFMSSTPQFVCNGEALTATSTGAIVDEGAVLGYALHTGAGGALGTILQINTTGTFSAQTVDGLELATQYYISAVVGATDNSGAVVLNDPCTVVSVGTPVAFLNEIEIQVTEDCNADSTAVNLQIVFTGGLPELDNTATYALTGSINTNVGVNQVININDLATGTPYNLQVSDEGGCQAGVNSSVLSNCSNVPCTANAGTMSNETLAVCFGQTVTANVTNIEMGEGDVLLYYLHANADNSIGQTFGTSPTGIFNFDDLLGAQMNEEYYISAVVAPQGAIGGLPDLNSPCASIAAGTPVVFLESIVVLEETTCHEEAGNYTVQITITGGLPNYTGNVNYIVQDGSQISNNVFELGPFADGEGYSVGVVDGNACVYQNDVSTVDCEFCDNLNAGVMSSEANYVCSEASISLTADGAIFNAEANEVLAYIVHDSPDETIGNIVAISETGIFSFADLFDGGFNMQYYISAVVGRQGDLEGIPDFDHSCTQVAAGTPIVFLAPIGIFDLVEECNPETGEVSISAIVLGGLPAFDANSPYLVDIITPNGASSMELLGNSITIDGLGETDDYEIGVGDLTIGSDNDCERATVSGTANCIVEGIKEANITWTNTQLHPNPVQNQLNLQFTSLTPATMQWSLTNLSGRVVNSQSFGAMSGDNQLVIDMEMLPSGLYLLRLLDMESGTYEVVKVVKGE